MMKRVVSGLVLAVVMSMTAAAQIVIRIGPPRAVSERRPPAPGRGFVWVPGYQSWDGRGYAWTGGRWEQPPRRGARWQKHQWRKRNGGWVLEEGRWR